LEPNNGSNTIIKETKQIKIVFKLEVILMGKTLVEKILSERMNQDIKSGDTIVVDVDFAALHDGSGPLMVRLMHERGWDEVFNPNKVMFCTEFGPVPTKEVANEHKLIRDFANEKGCRWYEGGTGCIHTHLLEDYVKSGEIFIIGDSHTTTHGAFGAFATGMGSTDMLGVMKLGKTWIKVPESYRVDVNGKLNKGVYSKDIMLKLLEIIGTDDAIYKSLEFHGDTISRLSMEARITITSMGVEAGAKTALMETDEETKRYLTMFNRPEAYKEIKADPDAHYEKTIAIDAAAIEPLVAKPHYVDNIDLARNCANVKVDMVYIGSCTNGRLEDMHIAADMLKGKKIAKDLRLLVIPNSTWVYKQALADGTLATLVDAGAMIMAPNCGPCMGVHQGIPADNEVVVATQNRNFKGRMGNPTASIYLSSPATAAATAVRGYITDPREMLD
jgi:3-isopropylmalate/(R)-2-methylmalate dehydratase large subunit